MNHDRPSQAELDARRAFSNAQDQLRLNTRRRTATLNDLNVLASQAPLAEPDSRPYRWWART